MLQKQWAGMLKLKKNSCKPDRKILEDAEQDTIKCKNSINGHSITLLMQDETTCLLQPEQSSSVH
jgi:hypothetical protein